MLRVALLGLGRIRPANRLRKRPLRFLPDESYTLVRRPYRPCVRSLGLPDAHNMPLREGKQEICRLRGHKSARDPRARRLLADVNGIRRVRYGADGIWRREDSLERGLQASGRELDS